MPAAADARTLALAALASFSSLLPDEAFAARPMITDDARVVDPKACQVESWIKLNRQSTEYWALPACNPSGLFEITYGGARIHQDTDGSAFTDNIFQLKSIVKPLEANGWGWGIAAGVDRHLHREAANGWPGDEYVYVPVSVSFRDDDVVLHVNGGAVHRRDLDRHIATWGLGSEIKLRDDLYLIPEAFGNDRGRPFFQLGLRHWIVKDRLQMDATFGNRLSGDTAERWFSVGLRVLSPPFLP